MVNNHRNIATLHVVPEITAIIRPQSYDFMFICANFVSITLAFFFPGKNASGKNRSLSRRDAATDNGFKSDLKEFTRRWHR